MENEQTPDHDILIEIKTKLERVIFDVATISNNLVGKVEKLECDKADKTEISLLHGTTLKRLDGLDAKVAALENWRFLILGGMAVLMFVIDYIVKKYL